MPGKYRKDNKDDYGGGYNDYSDDFSIDFKGMSHDMSYGGKHDMSYTKKGHDGYADDSMMDFTITDMHRGKMMGKYMKDQYMKEHKDKYDDDYPNGYMKGPMNGYMKGHMKDMMKDMKKHKKGVFRITICDKSGHPWEHRIVGTNDCLMVNGIKGGIIHVKRGETYKFVIEQNLDSGYDNAYSQYSDMCAHQYEKKKKCEYIQQQAYGVYLTSDPMGGHIGENSDPCDYIPTALPGTPLPTSQNCTFKVKIDKYFPEAFYYQTADYQCMGGLVIVHDN